MELIPWPRWRCDRTARSTSNSSPAEEVKKKPGCDWEKMKNRNKMEEEEEEEEEMRGARGVMGERKIGGKAGGETRGGGGGGGGGGGAGDGGVGVRCPRGRRRTRRIRQRETEGGKGGGG